jgi:hypothetical protein
VQKSLESEFLECDSMETIPTVPARHASMEGGLDNTDLLKMGSPKVLNQRSVDDEEDKENKENKDSVDFAMPRLPSPKIYRTSKSSVVSAGTVVDFELTFSL